MAATAVQEPKVSVEKSNKSLTPKERVRGMVSVKPFVSGKANMGHEQYGEVFFPNIYQMDRVGCIAHDNVKTYVTGLNEFSADVQGIWDENERRGAVKVIRETVAWLENRANANFTVRPETCMDNYGQAKDDFWENVTMFQSVCVDKFDAKGNRIPTYWDSVEIKLDNEGFGLDMNNPHDVAKYHIIMAGGFSMVAKDIHKAQELGHKFYMHKAEDVAAVKTEFKKLKSKAFGTLDTILRSDTNKLFYLAKACAPAPSMTYKRGGDTASSPDELYDDLYNYIDGKIPNIEHRVAVETFLKYCDKDNPELKVLAMVKDGTQSSLIVLRGNGMLTYTGDESGLGKTVEEAVKHLMSPLHEQTLSKLTDDIEKQWRS